MIIGLSGYAQAGKDTVAEYLVREKGFVRTAFADPIRSFLYETNPEVKTVYAHHPMELKILVDTVGWDLAKQEYEVRRLLQSSGMGARKIFGANFWVEQAFKAMDTHSAQVWEEDGTEVNWVITDVRFQNEANFLRSRGGQLWRVERAGIKAVNNHISEHDLDGWEFDAYVHNNTSIIDLEFAVQTTLNARLK